jgi:hypothetical protein
MAINDCKPSEMLIYIDFDGAAYELTAEDKLYIDAEFAPGDSGAPAIKCDYGSRNGWGLLDGFLMRTKLPGGVPIHPASQRPPSPQRARTARLRALAADATSPQTKARLLKLVRASEKLEAVTDDVAPPAGGGSR